MSGIFEGLLARLQIAKASLATCSPERRHKISSLQSAAVVEHLRALKTSKMFKSEHKANIMDATINIKFCSEHSDAILAELEDNPIHARRKGQDFTAWTAFCSAPEWVAIMSDQHDDATVINCIVEIIMVRLQCRNASEDTKKSIANVVLAKVCKTMDDVYCIPSWRKESIKRAVHKRMEQRKQKSAQPSLYLAALPCEPAVLRSEHPEFFVKVAVVRLREVPHRYCDLGCNRLKLQCTRPTHQRWSEPACCDAARGRVDSDGGDGGAAHDADADDADVLPRHGWWWWWWWSRWWRR